MQANSDNKPSFWHIVTNRKMIICVFTGLASGLPLYILLQLLPAWLTAEGINLKTISLFGLTQLPYTWKFFWSPLLDYFAPLGIGRRRSWMLLTQLALLLLVASLGLFSPQLDIKIIALLSFLIALFSATQDIALDAFRREILSDAELGLGNSLHINAYRLSSFIPGALSLILSQTLPWNSVFIITALFMLPAIVMTVLVKEPINHSKREFSLQALVIKPFVDILQRYHWQGTVLILLFIFLYKLGDSMATALATPFYMQMGFSRLEIGLIAKNAGLWPNLIGALLGGALMIKIGLNRALWLFGFVQMFAILSFAWLASMGPFTPDAITTKQQFWLAAVIASEAFGTGLGTAAFVTFIARTTNPLYSATQFALFTSISALPRTLINAVTGHLVEWLGWVNFFWFCFIAAIPGMLLLYKIAPWRHQEEQLPQ